MQGENAIRKANTVVLVEFFEVWRYTVQPDCLHSAVSRPPLQREPWTLVLSMGLGCLEVCIMLSVDNLAKAGMEVMAFDDDGIAETMLTEFVVQPR